MSSTQQSVDVHASRSNQILIPAILCPALATITVLLRLYARFVILKTPAADDVLTAFALVSYFSWSGCYLVLTECKVFSIGTSICQVFGKIDINNPYELLLNCDYVRS